MRSGKGHYIDPDLCIAADRIVMTQIIKEQTV
jgi:hypothetical protein